MSFQHTVLDVQVGQFKRLLGVKPTPKKELRGTPVVTHPKSLKLPKNFDARTQWSQCSTIGRILGHLLVPSSLVFLIIIKVVHLEGGADSAFYC